MPVTIGRVTSNVSVVDTAGLISPELMEQIVRLVMARLKQEGSLEAQLQRDREIPQRMSDPAY
jgi:hypothetical protein